MSRTCPSCGYFPIGPFIDNCPICAEPIRGARSDFGGRFTESLNLPPLLMAGWIGIALTLAFLFWGDWAWILLGLWVCGAAWWAALQARTFAWRWLGRSLLFCFIPGIWLASQPQILPGLDQRDMSPQRIMQDMSAFLRGTSRERMQFRARMKTVSMGIYAVHAVVGVPLAFLLPAFGRSRPRRRPVEGISLSPTQVLGGLAVWLVLVCLLGWLVAPTVQGWTEAPKNPIHWPDARLPRRDAAG
jgi:hypothetical protein